jgi:hypothetical protein
VGQLSLGPPANRGVAVAMFGPTDLGMLIWLICLWS